MTSSHHPPPEPPPEPHDPPREPDHPPREPHHPPREPGHPVTRTDNEWAESRHAPPTIQGLDIVGPIASGGHSVVYLARQEDHNRPVAVKVLNAALDETSRRRFDRERATLGRVSTHPAVIGLFDSGVTTDGRAFLVLEWAPNGSLAEHLAIDGPMSPEDVTALGICLAGALEHAHRSGVMHRDIKPSNIVRSEYGDWLLTDFSVAAFDDPQVATDAIQVSFAHCAPESFAKPDPSASADVYSLASVLATALTGAEPNAVRDDETVTQAITRIVSKPVPPLPRSIVGERLGATLERALAHEVDDRHRSMRAFAADLADIRRDWGLMPVPFRIGSDVTVSADGVGSIEEPLSLASAESPALPRRRHRRRRPNRIRHMTAAALAVIVLGGGYATAAGSGAPSLSAAPLESATSIVAQPTAAGESADGTDDTTDATALDEATVAAGETATAATSTTVDAMAVEDEAGSGRDDDRSNPDGGGDGGGGGGQPPPDDGQRQPPGGRRD